MIQVIVLEAAWHPLTLCNAIPTSKASALQLPVDGPVADNTIITNEEA